LETDQERFEISHTGEMAFRLAKVINPRLKDENFFKNAAIPLLREYVTVVSDGLEWVDLVWGERTLEVRTKDGTVAVGPLTNF